MTITEILTLLDSDLATGILAAADLREQRAKAAAPGPYVTPAYATGSPAPMMIDLGPQRDVEDPQARIYGSGAVAAAEHIAAEANPAHALAAVRHWRGVVDRHRPYGGVPDLCPTCDVWTPCPDLAETAHAAKAYLGAPS